MARRHRNDARPGHEDFFPLTDAERRAHADALARSHAGHDSAERAANLCQAGEYYAMLDDHDRGEQMFRDAVAVEHGEPGIAQAAYASYLLDRKRTDEALAMIKEARRLRPRDPGVFAMIGEVLAEHGHPQQAARWFTAGLVAHLGSLADIGLDGLRYDFDTHLLAGGRYQARQELGLPCDHIDALVLELRRETVTSAGD